MKKVGIMTWFSYYNYGSSLQVTALSSKIRSLGYDAKVINYLPDGKVRTLDQKNLISEYTDKIQVKIKGRLNREIDSKIRNEKFKKFISSNLYLTELCRTKSELFRLNDTLDAFVCGSDQIWAPIRYNPKYFLDFIDGDSKKISYAPSIGLSKIEDLYIKERMKELINKIKFLSIREEQGKNIIKDICGRDAKVVLDPTLLLTKEEWAKYEEEYNVNDKFILCYFLGDEKDNWTRVNEIAKKTNLKIKVIPVFEKDYKRGYDVLENVGPGEFLSLINKASLICTDSFHGTIFSINFEKNFYVFERFKKNDKISQNSRIDSILTILGIKERLITKENVFNENFINIDYIKVTESLNILRKDSQKFLEDSLVSATNAKKDKYSITNTCCGCTVCKSVCSKNAIEIKLNKDGFNEAIIDQEKCIECGLCKKVCPFNKYDGKKIDKEYCELYSLKSNDENVLMKSSSGGIAYEIGKLFNEQDYGVVGCVYDSNLNKARYELNNPNNIEGLNKFQGSKYIQSLLSDDVKNEFLSIGKTVIFGTPCHIAGMDSLLRLKKVRHNYILIDIICHGVPSYKLWEKYLSKIVGENNINGQFEAIFREKTLGWRSKCLKIRSNNSEYIGNEKNDLFYKFFELGNCYSEACYECKYRVASGADIRLGDYWGSKFIKDTTGVSMVISLTNLGKECIYNLLENNRVEGEKQNIQEYWDVQYPENQIKPVYYEELIEDFEKLDLRDVSQKYCDDILKKQKIGKYINSIRKVIR